MPVWSQHLLVIGLALACVIVIARQAMRALAGKKSGLSGCGSCKSCAPASETRAPPKVQMISADMLLRRHHKRM
jgi:hypothetical protein